MEKNVGYRFLLGLCVVLFFTTAAHSQDQYRAEVSGIYTRTDYEWGGRALATAVAGEIFFAPVKTANHPFAEAAFLEKIGSASLSAGTYDYKSFPLKGDGPYYQAYLNYTSPDFPLVLEAILGTASVDYEDSSYSADSDYYSIAIGKYLSYGLLSTIGYYQRNTTSTFMTSPTEKSKDHVYFFSTKYVRETEGGTGVNVEADLTRYQFANDDETGNDYTISLAGDYYFTRSLSAGLGFASAIAVDKFDDGKTYSANIRAFITPRLSLQAIYDRFLNDHDGEPSNRNFALILAARF